MNLKAKIAQIDEKNSKAKNTKDTAQVLWLEKAYGKNTRYASAKVYSK